MSTGWNTRIDAAKAAAIINLLGNEYWLERMCQVQASVTYYKPTGK